MILLVGVLVVSTTLAGGAMLTNFMAAAAVPGATTDVAVDATGGNVTITHVGGDSIAEGEVEVIISGASGENRYSLTADAIAREGDGDQWFETGERATFSHLFIGEIRVAVVDHGEQAVIYDAALAPEVVGDPANFSVTIDNTNSPIKENETLAVRTTVENVGDQTGAQTVELTVPGEGVVDSREVRLAGGTWEQIDLEWSTADGDAGDYTVTVSSLNDSDSAPVTVRTPSNFEVVIDNTSSPVNETDVLHVNATITNTGEDSDVQVIPLNISSEPDPVDYVTVGLDQGESRSVTTNWSTLNGDAGTHVANISTLDDSATTTVTVLDVDAPPYFDVSIDSTNSPVAAGSNVAVEATVENIGDQNGTQTIALNVTNQTNPVDTQSVTLQSGDTTTVTLVWQTANNDWKDSPYTATVSSENTTDSAQVNVTKKSEAGPTADAGGPYTVESGGTVTLDGSGSSSGTGQLTYNWSIVSGNGTLTSTTGETVDYQAPSVTSSETVTVELNVSDNKGSGTDQATITVTPGNPPSIDDVAITTSGSGNSINYTVDWNVSDPDGDLVNVTVQALAKGSVVDSAITTFSETSSRTGTAVLQGNNQVDTIRVIARDAEGLSAQNDTAVSNNNNNNNSQ